MDSGSNVWARERPSPPGPESADPAGTSAVGTASGGTLVRAARLLSDWRAAEREQAAESPLSPIWFTLSTKIAQLRAAYHRLFEEVFRQRPKF